MDNTSEDAVESLAEPPAAVSDRDTEVIEEECKRVKLPKRILQFSDGEMAEYSSEDDEADSAKPEARVASVDPKTLDWIPWAWYRTTWVGAKLLHGCDYVGEALADFLGITSPKYQFEIEEYHRMHAAQAEQAHRQDLEMGGWRENNKNDVITSAATK